MSKLKIGWAEEIFDLDRPVSLMGQFAERISQYVEKPLTTTAFAVESEGEQMVLCSVDLVAISYPIVVEVRKRLKNNELGLDPQKVVISAIHTHTGPGYTGRGYNAQTKYTGTCSLRGVLEKELPDGVKYIETTNITSNKNVMSNDALFEEICSKITQAVIKAWESRKEGAYSNAFGRAVVGHCRRVSYSDGTAQMWGDSYTESFVGLEGGSDSGIEILYVFDDKEKLTGIVANLACPAQCVQHRHFVSPDFWGEVKMLLRQHFGDDIYLLTLCGAAGDQCPVDLVRWVEPESDVNDPNMLRNNPPKRKADPSMFDLTGMKKVGKRIAREIIDVYEDGLDDATKETTLEHQVHILKLPLRQATEEEGITAKAAIQEYLRENPRDMNYVDCAKLQRHTGILQRIEIQKQLKFVDTEVHVMRLGSIAIATNPFELFLEYGNQIKARSKAEQTFIIQLACGAEGYLPTEKAEKGGHYSAFIPSGLVGHIGGKQLVEETLNSINGMFK